MNPVEAAFIAACDDELSALKPGNVHRHAEGHRMTVADFERSAAAAAPHLCAPHTRLGDRIRDAASATRAAVGQNTNLGILLLCGPLAMAAHRPGASLRARVRGVIDAADIADTQGVFDAILIAAPGGLGSASRHDVHAPATTPPRLAMAQARERDSIARQWACDYPDVFGAGLSAYEAAQARGRDPVGATLAAYLHYLADIPDSHIVRQHGVGVAQAVREEARAMTGGIERDGIDAMRTALLDWDARLKAAGINPGTSADLAVATGFTSRLQNVLP